MAASEAPLLSPDTGTLSVAIHRLAELAIEFRDDDENNLVTYEAIEGYTEMIVSRAASIRDAATGIREALERM